MTRSRTWLAIILVLLAPLAQAHTMIMTQVLVAFDRPGVLDVKIDLDLTLLLGSPEKHLELLAAEPGRQQQIVAGLAPRIEAALQLHAGQQPLALQLRDYALTQATRAEVLDNSVSKHSTFNFTARLPADRGALKLLSPIGAPVDSPVAYTIQIPAAKFSMTRWLEAGVHESATFEWAGKVGDAPASQAFEPDYLSWSQQLVVYLRLGFRHIVPEGLDHILFVLGLFFVGIGWRKLLYQTTVFTIAHATTLFLSVYGIFRLPGAIVEPAIALSITVIAIENLFTTRVGVWRLAIVFAFGLIHGLGFASSLSDVPFPKSEFFVALLGFNFGVDFGQLFVIALALLAVGWFRNKAWYRQRIAMPCSVAIAAVGLYWAVSRVLGG